MRAYMAGSGLSAPTSVEKTCASKYRQMPALSNTRFKEGAVSLKSPSPKRF